MKSKYSYVVLFILIVLAALPVILRFMKPAQKPISGSSFAMGSMCRITVHDSDFSREGIKKAIDLALSRIGEVDNSCSLYDESSDISKVNKFAAQSPVEVGEVFLRCLSDSSRAEELSKGLFNPVLRPVLNAWGFIPKKRELRVPNKEEVNRLLALCSLELVTIADSKVSFQKAGMAFDLNGIAQGLATDMAAEELIKAGLSSALVESGGGEFRAIGTKPDGSPFIIGVKSPVASSENEIPGIIAQLSVSNCSIATSGDYENYFEYEGKKYSHLIDPRTGMSKEGSSTSVTVVGSECSLCDAIATAASVLEPEEALRLVGDIPGYEVLVVQTSPDGPILHYTKGLTKEGESLFSYKGQ